VAFKDFLSDQPRVQAAEVGIRLVPQKTHAEASRSATEHKAEEGFLKQLRGKSSLMHIQAYEYWMSARSHRKLL
jgi:hypothetical protein